MWYILVLTNYQNCIDCWNVAILWSIWSLGAGNLQNHPGCQLAVGAIIHRNISSVLGACCLSQMWLVPSLIWNLIFFFFSDLHNLLLYKKKSLELSLTSPPLPETIWKLWQREDTKNLGKHCFSWKTGAIVVFWQVCQPTIFLFAINSVYLNPVSQDMRMADSYFQTSCSRCFIFQQFLVHETFVADL